MASSATKQRLLETALAIIDRDGMDAFTVRALVAESGVSNGSVYHHLGSLDRLRATAANEAMQAWSTIFLTALEQQGYAAAAAADRAWRQVRPGLADLLETKARRGEIGTAAVEFGRRLRAWLDSRQLAIDAPGHLVAAIMLGPLSELRRLETATGTSPSDSDYRAVERAVLTGLKSLHGGRSEITSTAVEPN